VGAWASRTVGFAGPTDDVEDNEVSIALLAIKYVVKLKWK
jgi:hypothetical protein